MRAKTSAIIAAATLVIATASCSSGDGSDAASLPDAPVSLTFTGQLQGSMTTATNVHEHTDDDPVPALTQNFTQPMLKRTQCADFSASPGSSIQGYLANVYGTVNGDDVALIVQFDHGSRGYENPGTSVDPWANSMSGGHANLQLPGDDGERDDVLGPPGTSPDDQSVTLNPDRRSGSIDAWFGQVGRSTNDSQNVGVIHVVGDWRCA